jgi:hypothetical protein
MVHSDWGSTRNILGDIPRPAFSGVERGDPQRLRILIV